MPTDEEQIREVIANWIKASKARDTAAVLDLMCEDVVFLIPGQPPMRGRETFAKMSANPPAYNFDAVSEMNEIRICGDYAYTWTNLSVSITPPGGDTKRRKGDILSIFRKDADGRWRLYRDANLLGPAD